MYQPNDTAQGINAMEDIEYSFSNLGIWRRIYLAIQLLLSGTFLCLCVWAYFIADGISLGLLILSLVAAAFSTWIYVAVSQRKLKQLKVIAFLSIIPMGNLVLLLIMLAIISTTKKEISA